jgi:hypothetical protein
VVTDLAGDCEDLRLGPSVIQNLVDFRRASDSVNVIDLEGFFNRKRKT